MTLPLFDYRPPVTSSDVAPLLAYLSGKGWVKARSMADRWSDRQLRELAHASQGQIIGGNRGYRLTLEASAEELNEATGRLRSQIRDMGQRVLEIERVYHQRRASHAA